MSDLPIEWVDALQAHHQALRDYEKARADSEAAYARYEEETAAASKALSQAGDRLRDTRAHLDRTLKETA